MGNESLPLEVLDGANIRHLLVGIPSADHATLNHVSFEYFVLHFSRGVAWISIPLATLEAPERHFDEKRIQYQHK